MAGVDLDTNDLYLLVVDGKQPGCAEGSTYEEVARILIDRGVERRSSSTAAARPP